MASNTEYRTVTLKVPLNYPPIENPVDIRIPLHWQQGFGSQAVEPTLGDLGDAMIDVYKAIDKELETLVQKSDIGVSDFGLYVALVNIMSEPMDTAGGPQFYLVIFEKGCGDDWALIDKDVREIVGRHYNGLDMEAPPIRYR